jgi:hypothetical protein
MSTNKFCFYFFLKADTQQSFRIANFFSMQNGINKSIYNGSIQTQFRFFLCTVVFKFVLGKWQNIMLQMSEV